jgi:hypothetical protein
MQCFLAHLEVKWGQSIFVQQLVLL